MKKCSNCKMTVDTYCACPVCNYDLKDTPEDTAEFEKYRFNKYFLIYLLKSHKFSLFCTIATVVTIFATKAFHYFELISLGLIVYMWFEALYKNRVFKLFGSKYTDDFLESTHRFSVYSTGILAVAAAVIAALV